MGSPKIPGGYIILSRKIVESEIWSKPPLYLKVWIYLLNLAQHADYKKLKRGQLIISIPEIIEACSWKVGYRTEKPKKDQVYQVIDWLRKANEAVNEGNTKATMITTTKATQKLLITIDNYDFYQTPKNYESNDEDDDETESKAIRKQRQPNNINKNVKNEKNEKEEIPFAEIISYLNKKTGRNFSDKSAANKKLINGRYAEGRTLEDFKRVIDVKCEEWMGSEQMERYLRPETLFNATKFDSYLNQDPVSKKQLSAQELKERGVEQEIRFNKWIAAGHDPRTEEFPEEDDDE